MESELIRFVDALPGFVWTAVSDGKLDFLNRRWLEYLLDLLQATGLVWHSAVHAEDLAELLERWRIAVESGQPAESEARVRGGDGDYRWFLVSISPLRDDTGRVVKCCALSTDIEARKRAEAALEASEHDRQRAVEALYANESRSLVGIASSSSKSF
jgi:PAS domain S-box-containing protein